MARVRHLLICLASGPMLHSGSALALGLGDITVRSSLNQPFDAQIQLIDAEGLTAQDIKLGLASTEAFSRSGVDWTPLAADLRFTPLLQGGRPMVRVQSRLPAREPYLTFLVELARPNGNLRREYTVLLDPPDSSYRSAASIPPSAVETGASTAASRPPARPAELPAATAGHRYEVRSGDSLWLIAQALRSAGSQASPQALMRDIVALNPSAFPGGDRSRLRVGASLLLPDSAAPADFSASAPLEIDTQPQPGERVTPDVEPDPSAPPAAAAVNPPSSAAALGSDAPANDPQMAPEPAAPAEAVNPEEGASTAAAPQAPVANEVGAAVPAPTPGDGDEQGALRQRVARLEEELSERDEGYQRLEESLRQMQSQFEQLQSQLSERDQEIAALREQLASAQLGQTPAPAAAPVAKEEPAGMFSWLALVALLGALLALVLLRRRRRPSAVVAVDSAPAAEAPVEPVPSPVAPQPAPQPLVVKAAPVVANATPREARSVTPDPLEAAVMYMAYGRSGEARTTLEKALQDDPSNQALRLKLLEVHGHRGDVGNYVATEQKLRENGCDEALLESRRAQFPHLDLPEIKDASASDELATSGGMASAADDDDFRLNLDDLSLDADWDLIDPFQQPQQRGKPQAEDPEETPVDNDFESDLKHLPEVQELDQGALAQVDEEELLFDRFDLPDEGVELISGLDDEGGEHLGLLNQALAYIEAGERERACDILNEVISEGDERERQEARELLARIA